MVGKTNVLLECISVCFNFCFDFCSALHLLSSSLGQNYVKVPCPTLDVMMGEHRVCIVCSTEVLLALFTFHYSYLTGVGRDESQWLHGRSSFLESKW